MTVAVFDLSLGLYLKEQGMSRAAMRREDDLAYAKSVAIKVAQSRSDRRCWADLVQQVIIPQGIDLGNAAGSLFKGKEWKFTEQRIKSSRAANHAREQKVWEYVR